MRTAAAFLPRGLAALFLTASVHAAAPLFDNPHPLEASSLQPAAILHGSLWSVDPTVTVSNHRCAYSVESSFGPFYPRCDVELYDTIREIRAIATIKHVSKTKTFTDALARAATKPIEAAGNVIAHPVDSVAALPSGAWRFLQGTAARVNEQFSGAPDSRYQDHAAMDLIGFSAVKRALAARLGVDPYSSNPVLQKNLNDLAWTAYAGQIGISAASALIPVAAVSYTVSGLNLSQDLTKRVVDNSPTDLRILNRKDLVSLGVDKKSIERFFGATAYSPVRATVLVESLMRLRGVAGLSAFVSAAGGAKDAAHAIFFQRTAQMLAAYHQRIHPLKSIIFFQSLPIAKTLDGRVAVLLAYDYVWWTPKESVIANGFQSYPHAAPASVPWEYWISGRFSSLAAQQLTALGAAVYPGAIDRLLNHPPR